MEPQLLHFSTEKGNNTSDHFIYSVFENRPAVDVQDVDYGYNKNVLILNKLSLKIPRGRIFALLGSSGCGKTTLLRLVLGRLQPISGSIKVFGIRPASAKSNIPGPGVGYMPQETALFDEFTISEILCYFGILFKMSMDKIHDRINHLRELLNLPKGHKLIGQLSGGQKRLVSMAVTMFHNPSLLILDEPTVGVDSVLRCRIWDYLEDLCKNNGTTVVITTHYLEEATTASNVAYIESGALLVQSNPTELMVQYKCQTLEESFLKISLEKRHKSKERVVKEEIKPESIQQQNSFVNNLCSNRKKFVDPKHVKALLWRNNIRIRRNPVILLMLLLLPVIQITLYCVCAGGKFNNIAIAIHEPDLENDLSHHFLRHIDRDMIREEYYRDRHKAIDSVRKGKSYFALFFSQNFSDILDARIHSPNDLSDEELEDSNIKLYADNTYSAVSPLVHLSLIRSTERFLGSVMSSLGFNPSVYSMPFQVMETVYGNINSTTFEFAASGVIIATIRVTTMLFSSLLIVMERKDGHLDRALVTGVNSSEILISHIIMLFVCVFVKTILLMIFSFVLFDIPLRGSVSDAFALILLQGLQGMCFGLLVSIISSEETIALITIFSVEFPLWFLCAVFWPIEAIPRYLRVISYSTPLTLPIDSLRSVLLRGWTLSQEQVFYGCAMSLAYILVLLLLSFVLFRKTTH